jgi:hypothetical protein
MRRKFSLIYKSIKRKKTDYNNSTKYDIIKTEKCSMRSLARKIGRCSGNASARFAQKYETGNKRIAFCYSMHSIIYNLGQ